MNCIAIFEDNKGFTRTFQFVKLPYEYKFVEYEPIDIAQFNPTTKAPKIKETIFYRYGEMTEVYGQTIQRYRIK